MASSVDILEGASRHLAEGKLSLAEDLSWSVLAEEPCNADALHLLGWIAKHRGNWDQAIDYLNRSLLCDGAVALTWLHLGDMHLDVGDLRAAIANYEQALRLRPDFGEAYNNLGVAWQRLGECALSASCFQDAIRLMACPAEAYNNLGISRIGQGKPEEAAQAFEHASHLEPGNPEFCYNRGVALYRLGELDGAVICYRQALSLHPTYVDASNNLAVILKEQGLIADAIVQFQKTLRIRPDFASAYYNLSEFAAEGHYQFTSAEIERVKGSLFCERATYSDRSLCSFTLATVLNKQGSYDEAFAYYKNANDLRNSILQEAGVAFDVQSHAALIERIMAVHECSYFERVQGWGLDTEVPVFIIGMPRSGTTLVEQILASHPQVFGAGELGEIPRIIKKHAADANIADYAAPLVSDQGASRDVAVQYLQCLTKRNQAAARVTIKTLENYLHLGVIATLFPRARVIHCRRHPLDVCLSCYLQNFRDLAFTCSLEDIGAYYRAYDKLMLHWSLVLPLKIHEVCYEDLVHDQESVTRNLLFFCGLDWDERCLGFWKTHRAVRTASTLQVRKPISNQSVGRWKRYYSHLGPLREALGHLGDTDVSEHDVPDRAILTDQAEPG